VALTDWIDKVFVGGLGRLEKQNAAQQVDLLPFPVDIEVDGQMVTVRPMEPRDRDPMLAFAQSLPEHDLLFLRRDITRPENVDEWIHEIAAGRYSSLVVCSGNDIVGYATVASDGMTWTRHVAELRLLLAPRMRGHGLGEMLTAQCFVMARERGIRKMVAQMTTDQDAAIRAFEKLGFSREAVLHGQVMDRAGGLHDLAIMALDVERFHTRLAVARGASVGPVTPI
jgi:L-amino acid N-acyltransferase YncA